MIGGIDATKWNNKWSCFLGRQSTNPYSWTQITCRNTHKQYYQESWLNHLQHCWQAVWNNHLQWRRWLMVDESIISRQPTWKELVNQYCFIKHMLTTIIFSNRLQKSRGQNSSRIQRKRRPACILYCLDLWVESPSFIFLRQVYNFWGMVQNNVNNKSPAATFDTAVQCPQYQPFHEIHVPCVISIATSHSGNSRYHDFDLPPFHWPTQQKIWWHRCLYTTHCPNCMMHWGCVHGQ